MNNFEQKFFKKYIPEGQVMKNIIHQHWIKIIGRIFFWIFGWTILPTFVYYHSIRIKELIPFYALEILLILVFIKVIYDIFDWYNDVWILTDDGVIDLNWKIFKTNTTSVAYENIEGMEVDQNGIIDKILRKGDLIIHKIGDDIFSLPDCAFPYHGVDNIEMLAQEKADMQEDDKFDMVMETLSGVVEDYLERKGLREIKSRKFEHIPTQEIIEEAERKDGTIDLR